MVVIKFLVADRQAKLADSRRHDARADIEIVLVAAPAIEVAQPQPFQLGAVRCDPLGRIEGEPSREYLVAQFAGGALEGQVQIECARAWAWSES